MFSVMPGHSGLPCADCVNLSAMPGIHVLAPRKTWMAGTKPGHDERENYSHVIRKRPGALTGSQVVLKRSTPSDSSAVKRPSTSM